MRCSWFDLFLLPVFGGILGCGATYLLWILLGTVLWFPYWAALRKLGMYTHDVEMTYLIPLGPPVVGLMFLLTSLMALVVMRVFRHARASLIAARVLQFVPGLATFVLLNSAMPRDRIWHYPLAEISVLLIGALWGWWLVRQDGPPARKPA